MFHRLSRFSHLFAAALLALAFALADRAGAVEAPLIIAQPADLSGPGADFGRDFSLGAKIYFDHVNAGGGINGHRLHYRQADTGGSGAGSLNAARALAREGAQVLFGATAGNIQALAQDPAIRGAGIPLFAPVGASAPASSQEGVFPLRTDLAREVRAIVAHLAGAGIKTFGIAAGDDFSREAIAALEPEFARQGARLLARVAIPAGAEGPNLAAQQVAQARPQAVIALADTLAVAQFVKRYRQLDPGAFLSAPSLVNIRTLVMAVGQEAARGLIISQVVPNPNATLEIAREHRRLMERYADEPPSQATLEGFIAAKAMVHILRRSRDLSRNGIQQAMREGGRLDLGGFELNVARADGASAFVELTVVSRDGRLLR